MELIRAKELAIQLMQLHGIINNGWTFKFDNAKRRFGCCNYSAKQITLSKHMVLINSIDHVKDTILHEIAHVIAGVGNGHNRTWKSIAIKIGCNGDRCYNPTEVNIVPGKYMASCPGCNQIRYRHKKPRYNSSCGKCSGGYYNENYKLNFVKI